MLQCNIFPGLPPDFLDSEVNLFLVPFMDSDAESETPPRAGTAALDVWATGRQPALVLGEGSGPPAADAGAFLGTTPQHRRGSGGLDGAEP